MAKGKKVSKKKATAKRPAAKRKKAKKATAPKTAAKRKSKKKAAKKKTKKSGGKAKSPRPRGRSAASDDVLLDHIKGTNARLDAVHGLLRQVSHDVAALADRDDVTTSGPADLKPSPGTNAEGETVETDH